MVFGRSAWGARVRELRENRGWSMDQLAAKAHPKTTGSQINKLEQGERRMTEDWVRRLAQALGVPAVEIIAPGSKPLDDREYELVSAYRGLAEEHREALFKLADALPRAPNDEPVIEQPILPAKTATKRRG
jgi:transcriptional regulator with XRE-family HTH domain